MMMMKFNLKLYLMTLKQYDDDDDDEDCYYLTSRPTKAQVQML